MGTVEAKKKTMLVVDDVSINRMILTDLFSGEFEVLEAQNGQEALATIGEYGAGLSIVLLDIVMPVMDGFGVLRSMSESGLINTVPVIFITGENDDEKALMGYSLGVSDLIQKPFNTDIVYRRVNNVVALYSHKQDLEHKLKEQREMLQAQARKLQQSNQALIDAISSTVEFRDEESGEHVKRIRVLTRILLEGANKYYPLTKEEIETISNASVVHDIGKIAIPDAILQKPGRLTAEEFEIMKTHTTKGCAMLKTFPMEDKHYFQYCYDVCRHHHERWDGRGYPDGLKGDSIPVWAQATSVADVYDALTAKRVYKEAIPHEKAINMILNGECGVFNPKMLESLVSVQASLSQGVKVD
ncbi:MAG: response regulator [Spirochaetales bacterium]|jgi:putative two-component system response regulator|nr:response regulator [Spirochaetales bacterium]